MADDHSMQARHADMEASHDYQPPKTWLFIPFSKDESADQHVWAQAIIDEHDQRGRHKRPHEIVQHDPNNPEQGLLSKVKPNDNVMVLAHGDKDDPEHLFSHREPGKGEEVSTFRLTEALLQQGLIPKGVGIKIAACYSGGISDQATPESALQQNTFAKKFAKDFTEIVGRHSILGLPKHVDGYVGSGAKELNPITLDAQAKDGFRKHSFSLPANEDQQFADEAEKETNLLKESHGDGFTQEQLEELGGEVAAAKRPDLRARLHRVRYKAESTGKDTPANVSIDQNDFEKAKRTREALKQGMQPKAELQEMPQPLIEPPHLIHVANDPLVVQRIELPAQLFELIQQRQQQKPKHPSRDFGK